MRRPTLALLAAMIAGCTHAPAPAPGPPPPEAMADAPPPETTTAAPPAPRLYRLPAPDVEPPAWWLPPAERVVMPDSLSRTIEFTAVGRSQAIVSSMGGLLVIDAHSGVVGTRATDLQATWHAVDERDRIVVAHEDGSLWRAPTWDAPMNLVAHVPGALRWDLASGSIVATTAHGVVRSTDEGNSFTALPELPRPLADLEVFTRSDGVVVVQGQSDDGKLAAFSLPRRARRWSPAPSNVEQLERSGDWIADGDIGSCSNVLSRDGVHWVETMHDADFGSWESFTSLDHDLDLAPAGPFVTLGSPPAPSRRRPQCQGLGGGGFGVGGLGTGNGDEPLRGTTGPAPRPTARWTRLFGDAQCPRVPGEPWECAPGSPLTRPPHAGLWNEADRRLRSVELPPACSRPHSVRDAGGAGVLRCDLPKSISVWTIGSDATWHAEGTLPVDGEPPDTLTAAEDGTMMFHGQCPADGPCATSWLRGPTPLGGSWRALPRGDTLAYRVLTGGRALRIAGTASAGYVLSIVDGDSAPIQIGTVQHEGRTLEKLTVVSDRTLRLWFMAKDSASLEVTLDPTLAVVDAPTMPLPVDPVLRPRGTHGKVAAFGDYDDDGFDDLAVVRRDAETHHEQLVIVRGTPTFASQDDAQLVSEPNIKVEFDVAFYYIDHVGSAGDFNGDGYADLLISLVTRRPANEVGTEVYVVWGRSTIEPRKLSSIRAGEGGLWIGGVPASSGHQVPARAVGDIDGDGRTDLGLGLAGADDGRGAVYIVRGKADTAWIHLSDIARDLGGYVLRGRPGENLGRRLAAVGDIDGDGGQDLAVVATVDDHERIYVVRGGADRPHGSGDVAARSGLVVDTTTSFAVPARAGDFDGDGLGDLAIAERHHDGSDVRAGRVTIVYGRRSPATLRLADAPRDVVAIDGAFAFDELGNAVAAVGDLDGDGHDDLGLGAASATRNGIPQGLVHLVRGSQTRANLHLGQTTHGRSLQIAPVPRVRGWGTRVLAAGDVDGNGQPDLVVAGTHIEHERITPIQLVLHRSAPTTTGSTPPP